MTAYPRHAFDVPVGEPQPTLFTPLAQFFRRALRLPRRKPAVPEIPREVSGTATVLLTPPDGTPALGGRMLSEVRREHDLLSTAELAALHPRGRHPYPPLPVRLPRPDGEIVISERGTCRSARGRPRSRPSGRARRSPSAPTRRAST